jgi:hypothetical protein
MARPKLKDPRSEVLKIRVTPREKAAIAERARVAGVVVAEFLRARALGEKPLAAGASTGTPIVPAVKVEVEREVEEAMLEDPGAHDAFVARKTIQLRGQGHTTPRARELAEKEWAER